MGMTRHWVAIHCFKADLNLHSTDCKSGTIFVRPTGSIKSNWGCCEFVECHPDAVKTTVAVSTWRFLSRPLYTADAHSSVPYS